MTKPKTLEQLRAEKERAETQLAQEKHKLNRLENRKKYLERAAMTRLTKIEKETIVLFNEGEDKANIYTHNAGLKKRLAAFAKKYPDLCRLEKSNVQGGVSYELAKSRLSIRFLPPYSEERRQKASEYAKKHGLNSQQG